MDYEYRKRLIKLKNHLDDKIKEYKKEVKRMVEEDEDNERRKLRVRYFAGKIDAARVFNCYVKKLIYE